MQLPQICGPVLPVSHILLTLFMSMNQNWELRGCCLQTMFIPEQNTGENIAEAIQATLEAWDLQETHQVCITTDSGSNIINASERLQMTRLACFGHNLHLGITNALKEDSQLS